MQNWANLFIPNLHKKILLNLRNFLQVFFLAETLFQSNILYYLGEAAYFS